MHVRMFELRKWCNRNCSQDLQARMQSGNNVIRPASGNGVWIPSNNGSPLNEQQIIYTNAENTLKSSKRRKEKLLLIAAFIILLLLAMAIALYYVIENKGAGDICFTPDCIKAAATLLQSMNLEVKPCDNFYSYACGNWRTNHPASEPAYINNWFQESTKIQTRNNIDYLEKNNSDTDPRSVREARLVYKSCLDFESMEVTGLQALWDLFEALGLPRNPLIQTKSTQPWIKTIAKARRYLSLDLLFGTGVLSSLKNSSINQLIVAMPEDEPILPGSKWKRNRWRWDDKRLREKIKRKIIDEGEKFNQLWKKLATELIAYVINADNGTVGTEEEMNDVASTILDIQTEIILLENNDNVKTTSSEPFPDMYTLEELQFIVNNATSSGISKINWKSFFEAIYEDISSNRLVFDNSEPIMVRSVPYMELLAQLVEDMQDKAIEIFIWWNVIYAVASHVNGEMKELKEAMEKQILLNIPPKSRKEVCMETASALMKTAAGYQVKDYASEEHISEVKEMLHNVRSSFTNFIYTLDWMDEATKFATVEKLYSMNMFVGYPNWYNNSEIMEHFFANVTLKDGTHLLNVLHLLGAEIYNEFASLDYINNVNRLDAFFDPIDINAFYDPSSNSIIVPYGIIQQPYFNMGLQALNYGAIGTILGHEMTHGLDNTGRMYDKFGNYRTWWSNFSSEEFSKRANCYLDAYNNFYLESINSTVNGFATLGENIADDGGVRDSLAAYRSYVKKHGKEAKLPGMMDYTHDQLFFLSFANMWCAEYTDDALLRIIQNDEHSPNFVRVIVVLQNSLDFSQSWNCPKGSYMNPDEKCKLWE